MRRFHRPVTLTLAGAVLAAAAVPAVAQNLDPLTQVSDFSLFPGCTLDSGQSGFLFNSAEVEPWVVVNPTDPLHIVGTWQQDRWSNGGARGLAVGVSFDGGINWETVVIPGLTRCSGGSFLRASDPWLAFAPNGDLRLASTEFPARPTRRSRRSRRRSMSPRPVSSACPSSIFVLTTRCDLLPAGDPR